MKKLILIMSPFIAGIAAAILRYTTITNAVNAETGVPTNSAALSILFGAVIAILAVFLALSIIKFKKCEICDIQKDTMPYKFCAVSAALLFVASAIFSFFDIANSAFSVISLIIAIFAFLCGVCLLGGLKFRRSRDSAAFFSIIPIFFSAFTLLMFYRGNNSNPLVYSFSLELFALLFSMFSFYCSAAVFFGKKHPRRIVFASLSSIFLITTVLLSDSFLPQLTRGHVTFAISDILVLCAFLACNICNLLTISKTKLYK